MQSTSEVNASKLNDESKTQTIHADIVALTGAVYFLTAAVLFVALLVFVSSLDMPLPADETARSMVRWITGGILIAGIFGGYSMWAANKFAPK